METGSVCHRDAPVSDYVDEGCRPLLHYLTEKFQDSWETFSASIATILMAEKEVVHGFQTE